MCCEGVGVHGGEGPLCTVRVLVYMVERILCVLTV